MLLWFVQTNLLKRLFHHVQMVSSKYTHPLPSVRRGMQLHLENVGFFEGKMYYCVVILICD